VGNPGRDMAVVVAPLQMLNVHTADDRWTRVRDVEPAQPQQLWAVLSCAAAAAHRGCRLAWARGMRFMAAAYRRTLHRKQPALCFKSKVRR
jgi:hypothetical protein